MAANKTQPTKASVKQFLASVEPPQRRKDAEELHRMMSAATGEPATMWGPTMVGYGKYHYKYASGHEGDSLLIGFAPRKASLVVYLDRDPKLLAKLGKFKTSVSCTYINKLDDIDRPTLQAMIERSVAKSREANRTS